MSTKYLNKYAGPTATDKPISRSKAGGIGQDITTTSPAHAQYAAVIDKNGTLCQLFDDQTRGASRLPVLSGAVTIVDGAATSLFTVACAAGAGVAGVILATIFASDGTDHQQMTAVVTYAAVNKAATMTTAITDLSTEDAKAVSSGTLTLSWTAVDSTNILTVKLQPTGSLTETTYNVIFTVVPLKGTVALA